jgi:hypothetical protein
LRERGRSPAKRNEIQAKRNEAGGFAFAAFCADLRRKRSPHISPLREISTASAPFRFASVEIRLARPPRAPSPVSVERGGANAASSIRNQDCSELSDFLEGIVRAAPLMRPETGKAVAP